jgi:hypothetical protein
MQSSATFVQVADLGAAYDEDARFDHEDGQLEFILQHDGSAFSTIRLKQFKLVRVVTDMEVFLTGLKSLLLTEIGNALNEYRNIRYAVIAHVVYEKVTEPDRPPIVGFLRTDLVVALGTKDILPTIWATLGKLRARHVNFMRDSSGLRLKEVRGVDFSTSKYDPLLSGGSAYVELPDFLLNKRAIVNVQNKDKRCFAYALLSALHPVQSSNRPNEYNKFFDQHPELRDLHFPVEIDQLRQVEEKIGIAFNVFSFFDDVGRGRYPVYLSKLSETDAIDLLFWNGHYAWIKHFSRFMADTAKHNGAHFYCKRCLGRFTKAHVLKNHQLHCISVDDCKQVLTMPPEGTKIKFINVRHQQKFPFTIYADFESLTVPCDQLTDAEKKQQGVPKFSFQKHKPISVGLKLVCSSPGILDLPYETYTGEDVNEWFLQRLAVYRHWCHDYLFNEQRLIMTEDDQRDFEQAVKCYICRKSFASADEQNKFKNRRKVRDHDHITGAYRGPAHSACNLKMRTTYKIPIFLHNFRNYDSHLIVPAFNLLKGTRLEIIGQNLEKYLTLTWDSNLVFKDSLQFLSGSLEQLVACLLKSGKQNFVHLREAFATVTDEEGIEMLLRKGVYPYDYMGSEARLQETCLPARQHFFSRLTNKECSEEDYDRAQRVWAKFSCKTMQDYHDLYLKTDVLLLADVFESFRRATINTFGLDPAYYVSAPQLSWDCMLKMTQCELELLSDPAMFKIINDNLRGGVSVIMKRHAVANNKYMGEQYDPDKPSSYIFYLDANNLYGWAMSEPLPCGEFVWMTPEECEEVDWRTLDDGDSDYGYFVECDFHYPDSLHDEHNDYPFAPERLVVEERLLSEQQLGIREQYTISHNSYAKLIPNFFDKTKQLVHYRNLRFYLENGLQLTKVHRAIRFKQSRWLQPYVQTNTELRAKSKDPVETRLRKDMNNSIYGKTCENLTKRSDIKLINSQKQCQKLINKPHCRRFKIFAPNLAAIELQKLKCMINKPTYVGFAVLELSKLLMYKFHYCHLRKWYPSADLLFTDTDSLVYQIYTDDLYADLAAHREHFDFSCYPNTHALFDESNKMVMGKMKDESCGDIITEFVGLRPKMYSYTVRQTAADGGGDVINKESKRAKGIQRAALTSLAHSDYLKQLKQPVENYVNIVRIGQKQHRVYTISSLKRGLCAFDDKRYLLPDGVRTLAHGHYRVREQQQQQLIQEAEEEKSEVAAAAAAAAATAETVTSMRIVGDEGVNDFVVLSAAQTRARSIRTQTQREALDMLSGVNLREVLEQTASNGWQPANDRCTPAVKRARTLFDNDDKDVDDVDECLTLIHEAATSVVFNDEY